METQKIKVPDIRTDGGTQMRVRIHEPTVKRYAELMKDGTEFPPPIVFFDGKNYWLADGFHRLEAKIMNDLTAIKCEVREGSRRDAVLFSVAANAGHGLPRASGDIRRAVESLLVDKEWGKWSNAAIASKVGCVVNTVHIIRRRLVAEGRIEPRDSVTCKIRGKVKQIKSHDGRDTSQDHPNYGRDWLKFLVGFSAGQFLRWKEQMSGRGEVNRYAAAEAVEVVVVESAHDSQPAGAGRGNTDDTASANVSH